MKKIYNSKVLKDSRKNLRNNATSAEATLWTYLKGKQLCGRKFRRQQSIENYIVDFYCFNERLVIELDGAQHYNAGGLVYDEYRDMRLETLGLKVLRFENVEIFENIESVLEEIKQQFKKPC
jgi:very-short-patch-repair endonuclease